MIPENGVDREDSVNRFLFDYFPERTERWWLRGVLDSGDEGGEFSVNFLVKNTRIEATVRFGGRERAVKFIRDLDDDPDLTVTEYNFTLQESA